MRRPANLAAGDSFGTCRSRIVLCGLLAATFAFFLSGAAGSGREFRYFDAPILVAHGGGGLPQEAHTNSLEALENSKSLGFCFVEVDFDTKSDTISLARKSIDGSVKQRLAENLTPMTLASLLEWMRRNPGIRIITDTKDGNERLLAELAMTDRRDQFIAQIYDPSEYENAVDLGFGSVILTLYRSKLTDDEVVEFARGKDLFAVTIPRKRAAAGSLAKRLEGEGVTALSHTINAPLDAAALMRQGVSGFYTDYLMPTSRCVA